MIIYRYIYIDRYIYIHVSISMYYAFFASAVHGCMHISLPAQIGPVA